jgi:hypothetical protein
MAVFSWSLKVNMLNQSVKQRLGKWLAVAALLGCSLAMAQAEPTLKQVYDEAQAGRFEQAQVMMQQVLVAHPGSAKAHFVQAELFARQGKMPASREALATAEKLAPGLTFAKPEAVTALRAQLAAKSNPPTNNGSSSNRAVQMAAPVAPAASFPWGIVLALGGGAIALVIYMQRKKDDPVSQPQGAYANASPMQGGLNGQQGFGMGNNMPNGMNPGMNSGMNPGMNPGYAQPQGSGMGGRIMGGLATGLAVGAGVMAAQAIGKSLMGNETPQGHQPDNAANNNGYEPFAGNNDMGGQNFGLNDASSWDDNSSSMASSDGGGDWDS